MTEHRACMMKAFKTRLVPGLRERGFAGSFPYFQRRGPARVDCLMIRFDKYGGRFIAELGRVAAEGLTAGPWRDLPVARINPTHLDRDDRFRLAPPGAFGPRAQWFEFGPADTDDPMPVKPDAHYEAIADRVLALLDAVGEPWLERAAPPGTGAEPSTPPARPPLIARLLGFR